MELVEMKDGQAMTTSLIIAQAFNKRHTHVLDAIENKIHSAENSAQYQGMFKKSFYKDTSGKQNKMYFMTRDGFTFIAFGFTGKRADEFKLKYIQAFNDMEKYIIQQQELLPMTPREKLKLMLEAQEETAVRVDQVEKDIKYLKEEVTLDNRKYSFLGKAINRKVSVYIRDWNLELTTEQRKILYRDINLSVNELCSVRTRSQIKEKDFDKVMSFVYEWQPSSLSKAKLRELQSEVKQYETM